MAANEYPRLEVENTIARRALAVGATRAGGNVEALLAAYLATPCFGGGETSQAFGQMRDAVYHASASGAVNDARDAAVALIDAALAAGWPRHPSRR